MSGGSFVNALAREMESPCRPKRPPGWGGCTPKFTRAWRRSPPAQYAGGRVRPLPGARELLPSLTQLNVPWAIATIWPMPNRGHLESAQPALDKPGLPAGAHQSQTAAEDLNGLARQLLTLAEAYKLAA